LNEERVKNNLREYRAKKPEAYVQARKKWAAKNKDRLRIYARERARRDEARKKRKAKHQENREELRAKNRLYRALNHEAISQRRRERRQKDPERFREATRRWAARNVHKITAKSNLRKSLIRKRVPPWITSDDRREMDKVYEQARRMTEALGEPFHVDHIVPLQGEVVSGLHVPWNLQVIEGVENVCKSNSLRL